MTVIKYSLNQKLISYKLKLSKLLSCYRSALMNYKCVNNHHSYQQQQQLLLSNCNKKNLKYNLSSNNKHINQKLINYNKLNNNKVNNMNYNLNN